MELEVKRDGKTSLVKPSEEIHFDNYKEVEAKLLEEIEAGAKEVVVDLSNVTTLYSMTLGMFNNIATKVAKKGGQFCITNINNDIRRVLKATRLDRLIQIK
jgi:anti-sigma B factor antagonist